MSTNDAPNTITATNATQTGTLPLGQVTLLGVFGPSGAQTALVRLASGRVKRVTTGDHVGGGRVARIEGSRITLVKPGKEVELEIPGD
ncbi:MAG: pilus assembly protein PilP [Brevirhabdus sp.]